MEVLGMNGKGEREGRREREKGNREKEKGKGRRGEYMERRWRVPGGETRDRK